MARGRPAGSLNRPKRGRPSLSKKMLTALTSNDPEKIAEVRKKVESSSKAIQEKVQKVVQLFESKQMMQMTNESTKRANSAGGEN